jgi:predicted metal-dependent hydrolase
MEVYHVTYGEEKIEFEVERKQVKNVNLNVKPDMQVTVSASKDVPVDFIKDFVREKAAWILKQQSYFEKVQPESVTEKEYVSGETFKYLGKQYRLKVVETVEKDEVKLFHGFFHLYVKDKNKYEKKQRLMDDWFRMKAHEKFIDSLDRMYPLIEKYGVQKPKLNIRLMKARWGSCLYQKNTILLNLDLIKAPKYCIDYVILHELIHFIHRDHNNQFYHLLTVLMPDWKVRKGILDKEVVRDL